MLKNTQNRRKYFGKFGGAYVAETLVPALEELENCFLENYQEKSFKKELEDLFRDYVGRPTPLYFARRLTKHYGRAKIYLKREDLNHTGAHKINNALGQALLAKKLGKKKIIAETGAGQHGVATATACALLDLDCKIYMGAKDLERQKPNVFRMKILGAQIEAVKNGAQTLQEATSESIRSWITNVGDTHYILGTASGPYPFPMIVKEFQSIIGKETKKQALEKFGKLPDYVLACLGGGSNAIGIFAPFLKDQKIKLIGLEAGGTGKNTGEHAATLNQGKPGVLHGTYSYLLHDQFGRISAVHSISAGMDYPGIGPEHSYLKESQRAEYYSITDQEALKAVCLLSELEGIIPALESAHAIAYLEKLLPQTTPEENIVINLSGRGDKDLETMLKNLDL